MKTPIARNLFLIVRGDKPESHKAPFHLVILCSRKHAAKWESMRTEEGHTVYECLAENGNWLLVKYKGYDIDYGTVAHYFKLFDGKDSREVSASSEIDNYLKSAIWFSYDQMPEWIKAKGVTYAADDFTKRWISEDHGACLLGYSKEQILKRRLDECDEPEWLMIEG